MLHVLNGAHVVLRGVRVLRGRVTDAPGEELYKGVAVTGAGVLVAGASLAMEAVTVADCIAIATDGSRTTGVGGAGIAIAGGASVILVGSHIDGCACYADADVYYTFGGGIIIFDVVPTPRSATLIGCTISNCSVEGGEWTVRAPPTAHDPTAMLAYRHKLERGGACKLGLGAFGLGRGSEGGSCRRPCAPLTQRHDCNGLHNLMP